MLLRYLLGIKNGIHVDVHWNSSTAFSIEITLARYPMLYEKGSLSSSRNVIPTDMI